MRSTRSNTIFHFDSPLELAEHIKASPRYERDTHIVGSNSRFYGDTPIHKLYQYCATGNDSLVSEAQAMLDKAQINVETTAYVETPEVAGFFPCVPEVLAGEPECMRTVERTSANTAPLSVVIDLTTSATISTDFVRQRGVLLLAFVMAMCATRPVSLYVCTAMDGRAVERERLSACVVRLNTAPLDLATACFALTDAGFYRRLFYAVQSREGGSIGGWPTLLQDDNVVATGSPGFCTRMQELLQLGTETLYLPPVTIESVNWIKAFNDPAAWVREQVERHSQAIA